MVELIDTARNIPRSSILEIVDHALGHGLT